MWQYSAVLIVVVMWQCGSSTVAVRWQYRVGSVGRLARSLIIGLVCRYIGTRSYQVHKCVSIRLIGLCLQVYQYGVLSVQVRMHIGTVSY